MALKLGKLPARENAVQLKLATYLTGTLPAPPTSFGHDALVPSTAWGMLGNDTVGDCVIAGGLHETLLFRATSGRSTHVSTACAIRNYELIAGYDPHDPSTDQGTDMQAAASYRRTTGLLDAAGHRHKVGAYVACGIDQLATALWIFGAAGLGVEFPAYAMDDFTAHRVWDVQKANATIEGGHYVALVGRSANGNYRAVTWGQTVEVTPRFVAKYADEIIVYLSTEMLTHGVTLDGFNLAQLTDDLRQVTHV